MESDTLLVVSAGTDKVDSTKPAAPKRGPGRWGPRHLLAALGCLAGGWLVTIVLNALHLDVVLPVLILFATASLLRFGRTILDRLVVAMVVLFGATCVAGLLFSVWPWGMKPVPVAGAAFTGLTLIGLLLRRRPYLPRKFAIADGAVVGGAVACAAIALGPFSRGGVIHNLGLVLYSEDFSRHFMMFDGTRCTGGYSFINPGHASECGVQHNLLAYPQGSHLFYALVENFVRSSPGTGDRISELGHLTWYLGLTYCFLCLAVLWAIRWVGGRWVNGWYIIPILGIAAGYLAFSDPLTLLTYGYPPEAAGLALLAPLLALFARPLKYLRTQLLFTGLLTIGISFTYYLWLPLVAIGWAAWFVRYRRDALRHTPLVAGMGVVIFALSIIAPLSNQHYNTASSFLLAGNIEKSNRTTLLTFLMLVFACYGLRPVRRLPVFRVTGLQVLVAGTLVAVIYVYQITVVGRSIYYFEKGLHGLMIVQLVSLATLAPALRRLLSLRPGDSRLAHIAMVMCLALVGAMVFAGPVPYKGSRGINYARGKTGYFTHAYWVVWAARNFPDNDGKFTIIQMSRNGFSNAWATLYLGMMQRNFAITNGDYHWLYPPTARQDQITPARIEANLPKYHVPIRMVIINPDTLAELRRFAAANPQYDLELVDGRTLYCPKSTPQQIPKSGKPQGAKCKP